jgi:multidrug efflux pump subunit AcrA (membrane-fusion protein)
MRVAVEGVGHLQPIFLSNLEVAVEGFVEQVFIERGQMVEAGQVVLTLRNEQIGYEVTDLEFQIERMRLEMARLLGVSPDRVTAVEPGRGITITAPIAGRVGELYVERGSSVSAGSAIARLVDDSQVLIVAELVAYEVERVEVGQEVEIRSPEFDGYVLGRISMLDRTPIPSGAHFVFRAEVEAKNPGLWQPGQTVNLTLITREGKLAVPRQQRIDRFREEAVVRTLAQGAVERTLVRQWTRVQAGDTLAILGGEATTQFIQARQLDIRQKELELARKQDVREKLIVRSPITGTVEWVHVTVGARVQPGWGIAAIFDQRRMHLHMMIDELDVIHVREGLEAGITVEALPGRRWTAQVLRVDMQGRTEDGIAQYGVMLEVQDTTDLKPGMTAHAIIPVAEKEDVLLIPIEAVFEHDGQTMVEVMEGQGPIAVAVTLGLVNDRFAEVLEGLTEGQLVVTGGPMDRLERDPGAGRVPGDDAPGPLLPVTPGGKQ